MADQTGLRERKKQRTRRALIETGLRLFGERGYDQTTITDVCAAAELSAATFYKHFSAKEDVVFADQPDRMRAGRDLMAERLPGEAPDEHLMRCVREMLSDDRASVEPDEELAAIRARLITTVPVLRAIALRWLFDVQHEWALALAEAHPEELDDLSAHAVVGSVVGAVLSAAMSALDGPRPLSEVVLRAARIALEGCPGRSGD